MKYTLDTQEQYEIAGHTLSRVVAAIDIPRYGIKRGHKGGFVEDESCLSQEGDSFVDERSLVLKGGRVEEDAFTYGDTHVFNGAIVAGKAQVGGRTDVCGKTIISGCSHIHNTVCSVADWAGGTLLFAYRDASMDPGVVDHLVLKDQIITDCEITGSKWLKNGTYLPLFKPGEPIPATDTPEAHLTAKRIAGRSDDDTFVSDKIAAML